MLVNDFEGNNFSCFPFPRSRPYTLETLLKMSLSCVCGNGMTTKLEGKECVPCRRGFYSNSSTDQKCVACPKGTVASKDRSYCDLCKPGTFASKLGASICLPCEPGAISVHPGSSRCDACFPGTHSIVSGVSCIPCVPGTYSSDSGASSCTPCALGMSSTLFGSRECFPMLASPSSVQINDSKESESFRSSQTINLKDSVHQRTCSFGRYSTGNHSCELCPAGSFAPRVGMEVCLLAPKGFFVPGEGFTNAIRCFPGTYSDISGSKECKTCLKKAGFVNVYGGKACRRVMNGEILEDIEWLSFKIALYGLTESQSSFYADEGFNLPENHQANALMEAVRLSLHASGLENTILHLRAWGTPCDRTEIECIQTEILIERAPSRNDLSLGTSTLNPNVAFHQSLRSYVEKMDTNRSILTSLNFTLAVQRHFSRKVSLSALFVESVDIFYSTRGKRCAKGFAWSQKPRATTVLREHNAVWNSWCFPCPPGYFSALEGSLNCSKCPRKTFTSQEGSVVCRECLNRVNLASTLCLQCDFLSYHCEGFWLDLSLLVVVSLAVLYKCVMAWCRSADGDLNQQQSADYQRVLVSSLRVHGHAVPANYMMQAHLKSSDMFDTHHAVAP